MKTDEEIRFRLDQLLRPPLTEEEWTLSLGENWINDIRESDDEIQEREIKDLVGRLRRFRRTYKATASSTQASPTNWPEWERDDDAGQLRIYAVARLLVSDANEFPRVQAFRDRRLDGTLLDLVDDLEPWLEDHSKDETPNLPGAETRYVQYLNAAGELGYVPYTYRRYTPGGVLQELDFSALELNERYGWSKEQAVNFLLCGSFPFADEYEVKIINRIPLGAATRIVLTVDPALTPAVVSRLYAQERERVLGKRYRSIDRKHMLLAWHHADYGDHTWAEQMRLWNDKQAGEDSPFRDPSWAYRDVRLFHRDTSSSVRRLLRKDAQPTYERKDATEADD